MRVRAIAKTKRPAILFCVMFMKDFDFLSALVTVLTGACAGVTYFVAGRFFFVVSGVVCFTVVIGNPGVIPLSAQALNKNAVMRSMKKCLNIKSNPNIFLLL